MKKVEREHAHACARETDRKKATENVRERESARGHLDIQTYRHADTQTCRHRKRERERGRARAHGRERRTSTR